MVSRAHGCINAVGEENTVILHTSITVTTTQSLVVDALEDDPAIDAIIALGSVNIAPALYALEEMGVAPGEILVGTFDYNSQLGGAMESGALSFAIDQQQWLQVGRGVWSSCTLVVAR